MCGLSLAGVERRRDSARKEGDARVRRGGLEDAVNSAWRSSDVGAGGAEGRTRRGGCVACASAGSWRAAIKLRLVRAGVRKQSYVSSSRPPVSSLNSQARASRQSRFTVPSETPSTSATSSMSNPPK